MEGKIFELKKKDGKARTGIIKTPSGEVRTPVFMPVATLGDVKTVPVWDLERLDVQTFIINTYHLHIRPGEKLISEMGGVHEFMNWKKPIASDSGGFQVYSLSSRRKVQDDGILFSSHIDGTPLHFTPEKVIDIQHTLGTDIMMPLDECVGYPIGKGYAEEAMERTIRWAAISKDYFDKNNYKGILFGIIQGSTFSSLRIKAARKMRKMDFDGYAIGGLIVGESKEQTWEVIEESVSYLPEDRPRYTMGVGKVADIIKGVKNGIDMFDCVIPTRNARTGALYTWKGKINIKNAQFKNDTQPVSERCNCPTCLNYSRAYLRHLFNSNEALAKYLSTIHNIMFYMKLMKEIRKNIENNTMDEWSQNLISKYKEE